jgi:hypothetical protein
MAGRSSVEFYGDWNKLSGWLERKQKIGLVLEGLEDAAEKLAKARKKKARQKMKSLDPQWPPLSSFTTQKKGHSQPFIDSGKYYESIEEEINRTETSLMILVGPERGITEEQYNYQYIGTLLEFGTSTIPARPLWRPLTKEVPLMLEFKNLQKALLDDFF